MTRPPQWIEIWFGKDWLDYFWTHRPTKTRQYYQLRSIVRMLIWVPFFVGCYYIILGGVAVFS
jgi:hypothetical protein